MRLSEEDLLWTRNEESELISIFTLELSFIRGRIELFAVCSPPINDLYSLTIHTNVCNITVRAPIFNMSSHINYVLTWMLSKSEPDLIVINCLDDHFTSSLCVRVLNGILHGLSFSLADWLVLDDFNWIEIEPNEGLQDDGVTKNGWLDEQKILCLEVFRSAIDPL